ncbi:MAG: hypothetical protein AAB420_00990 [Patescibacteria group bacterium]
MKSEHLPQEHEKTSEREGKFFALAEKMLTVQKDLDEMSAGLEALFYSLSPEEQARVRERLTGAPEGERYKRAIGFVSRHVEPPSGNKLSSVGFTAKMEDKKK